MRNTTTRLVGLLLYATLLTGSIYGQVEHSNKEILSAIQVERSSYADSYFLILSFQDIPDYHILETLSINNIELLAYQGNQSYLAAIPTGFDLEKLYNLEVKTIAEVDAKSKLTKTIREQNFSDDSKNTKKIDLVLGLNKPFVHNDWQQLCKKYDIELLQIINAQHTIQAIRLDANQITNLAQHPNIRWIQETEPTVQRLNYENRAVQKANILQSNMANGLNLLGEGVVVGVGDGGELGAHIDFNCRVHNQADGTYSSYGAHGDHVSGTIAGAGNLDPLTAGIAPKAELLIQKTTNIIYNTEEYVQEFGMVITNNSYGVGADCASNGSYNYSSINLDKQLRENEQLIHLFAAGNSGNDICGNYPPGYKTVLRYYGAAKNVLTVGAVDKNRTIANLSSRGPVADGRIKPEICGVGVDVESTGREFNYFELSGTSMATPAVAGTMALLYEHYRNENNQQNPKGALMKAIACNTAEDLGTKGPDYTYGFGLINAKRAADAISNKQYFEGNINHASYENFTIEIPENVAQLKVMLYWHDVEAEVVTSQVLVNDLDLRVIAPNNISYRPWILDASPSEVMEASERGFDRLNNIEQVTIDFPLAGNHEIEVRGYQIPMGVQNFHITYDFVYEGVNLTYPIGDEAFIPNSTELIQWEADFNNQSSFNLEYSNDGGQTWSSIAEDIPSNVRSYTWSVPNEFATNCKIRVSKKDNTASATNVHNFEILKRPSNLQIQSPCNQRIELTWDEVENATGYEIYLLECEEMKAISTTQENHFVLLGNLDTDVRYWFAVKAIFAGGHKSIRTNAVEIFPSTNAECGLAIDNTITTIHEPKEEIPETAIADIEIHRPKEEWPEAFAMLLREAVYPNPFTETLNLDFRHLPHEHIDFEVVNVLGRNVKSNIQFEEHRPKEFSLLFDDALPLGVYYIKVYFNEHYFSVPVVKL